MTFDQAHDQVNNQLYGQLFEASETMLSWDAVKEIPGRNQRQGRLGRETGARHKFASSVLTRRSKDCNKGSNFGIRSPRIKLHF